MDLLNTPHTSPLAVNRRWLYLISALLWECVGVMLCFRAYGWLESEKTGYALGLGLAGIVIGVLIAQFKFSKIVKRNIKRIAALREQESIFAFQSPMSYLLIAFMMGLGIALRHSPLPEPYLAVLYIGIGLGLFLSSLRYYRHVGERESVGVTN